MNAQVPDLKQQDNKLQANRQAPLMAIEYSGADYTDCPVIGNRDSVLVETLG